MTTRPASALPDPPPFVVRVTALPTAALRTLQLPETAAALSRAREQRDQLSLSADRLTLAVHEQVGRATDDDRRRLLLRLKRRAGEKGWSAETLKQLATLVSDLTPATDQHAACLRHYHAALAEGERTLQREAANAAWGVRDWSMAAPMREALLMSSPSLLADAERFWRAEALPRKTQRQVVASLSAYLVRAATKPSPFNRFTSMSGGEWGAGTSPASFSLAWTSRVRQELNLQVRGALHSAPGRQAVPEPELEIHLNPTFWSEPGAHVFLAVKGPVVRVRRSARLDALVSALSAGPLTVAVLRQRIDPLTPLGGLWRDLQRLQAVGMLELLPPAGWSPHGWAPLDAVFADFVDSCPHGRPGQLRRLQAQTRAAYTALDLDRLGWSPPDRNLVFEDSGAHGLAPVASVDAWQPILDDLLLVQQAYSLAEGTLENRFAFAGWFCRRYGAGARVPALKVYQDMLVEGRPWAAEQRSFEWPAASPGHLAGAIAQVRSLLAGDEHGVIDRQALATCLGDFPSDTFSPSYAFYGQLLGGAAPAFVLNAVQLGFGRAHGRARWILDEPPGAVRTSRPLLDLSGDFHANINRHACAHTHKVVANGRVPTGRDLSVHDLLLGVESPTARPVLWSATLDQPVWAVPLGLLGAHYLPPLYRFLTAMTVGGPIDPALPQLTPPVQAGGSCPRLQLGQVVLQRARWSLPQDRQAQLPIEADFQAALDVTSASWLQGLPAHVFARRCQAGVLGKPAFADLSSPLSWATLPRPAAGSELWLEEALPDPLAPVPAPGQVHGAGGVHVTEFVVEPRYA